MNGLSELCVWLASALSVSVGILACKLFARLWRD